MSALPKLLRTSPIHCCVCVCVFSSRKPIVRMKLYSNIFVFRVNKLSREEYFSIRIYTGTAFRLENKSTTFGIPVFSKLYSVFICSVLSFEWISIMIR